MRNPFILLFFIFLLPATPNSALAQKKKDAPAAEAPPPILLSPQSPSINPVYPFGMTRGTELEITLTGSKLENTIDVWTSFPCKTKIKSKSASEVKASLQVAAEASIGYQSLRLVTKQGISNAVLFCIDDLPQLLSNGDNRDKKTPQLLQSPCVVVGRVDEDKSDWYKITATKGQRLSFEVIGHRLGNPIDPILKLYDGKSGREIPGAYSDDPPCLQTDARITHTFDVAGDYLIEMRDTKYLGGPNFYYRLRIGDFPVGLVVEPMFLQAGRPGRIKFPGATIPDVPMVSVAAPATSALGSMDVAPIAGGQSGWPLPVRISEMTELMEVEPNNTPAQAMEIPVPCGVNAGFQTKDDHDYFRFKAKKGSKYIISADSYNINTPTEVYLQAFDKDQNPLAKSDPQLPTAQVEFTAPADGNCYLLAKHLNFLYGPGQVYHLKLREAEPEFELRLSQDRCESARNAGTLLPIIVKRKEYPGEIRLKIEGPPEITGTVVIPPNRNDALLPVLVAENATANAYAFTVVGEAIIGDKTVRKYASRFDAVRKELSDLYYPPLPMTRRVAVGIVPVVPIRGSAILSDPALKRGKNTTAKVKIDRDPTASEEVLVTAVGLPEGVTAAVKPIAKGSNETSATIQIDKNAPEGRVAFAFRFSTKVEGQDMVFYSPLIETLISK